MIRGTQENLWVVVEVNSGIPVAVRPYANEKSAVRAKKRLDKKLNPDDDEAGVFEVRIPPQSRRGA